MSVATTANSMLTTTLAVLADYELHHSEPQRPAPLSSSSPTTSAHHPQDWPVDHLRVPAYRPINRNLDLDERPAGSSAVEMVFIQTMLHGVWINAVSKYCFRERTFSLVCYKY
jgi:hypothetical protein